MIYHAMRFQIKKEQRAKLLHGIPESQVEIIAVENSLLNKESDEFKRVKEWEICYRGSMFDFFREETLGDSTYFYGITDHKENRLLANLKEKQRNSTESPSGNMQLTTSYQQLVNMLYCLPVGDMNSLQDSKSIVEGELIQNIRVFSKLPEEPPPNSIS
jgi:hypothetical protein